MHGLCGDLVFSLLTAGCDSQVDSTQLAHGRLCQLSFTSHAHVRGRVLSCVLLLFLHVCGLCAALLMDPQGTHLSVLNRAPGVRGVVLQACNACGWQ